MLTVMYLRPQPDESLWAPLREEPRTVAILLAWAAVLISVAAWGLDMEESFALLASAL